MSFALKRFALLSFGGEEVRPEEVRLVKVRLSQVRPAEVRLAEVRLAEVRPSQVRPAQVHPNDVRPDEVRPEVRSTCPYVRFSTDSRCQRLAGGCGDVLHQPWAASAFCVGEWLAALSFTPPLYHNHRPCQTPTSGPRPLRASAVQLDCSFSPRTLRVGDRLPQLHGTVLQDVDVIDLKPGLGRDLVSRPALDIPAVDDVRLAPVELRPCLPAPLRGRDSCSRRVPAIRRARTIVHPIRYPFVVIFA